VNDAGLNTCSADSPCSFFGVDQKLKTPYVMNWNLNVQHEIKPGLLLQVAYVANRGRNLYSTTDPNQVDPTIDEGDEQSGRPLTASCNGIGSAPCMPYISFLNFLGNKSSSNYQSLQTTLTHRYSKGLYLLAGYTWAHAIDTAGNTNNLGFVPQNSLDYAAEKGNGDYDIRHRFTLSATYDLPARKSFGQLLEGWQVTSILQWQTGYPILIYDNTNDLSLTGEGFNNLSMSVGTSRETQNLKWSACLRSHSWRIPKTRRKHHTDPACYRLFTDALLESLGYVGGCHAQNGTISIPSLWHVRYGTEYHAPFCELGRSIGKI
jgi:hypothetical protein